MKIRVESLSIPEEGSDKLVIDGGDKVTINDTPEVNVEPLVTMDSDQEVTIEDGSVFLNGVEIGRLNRVLKRGFHPVGELVVGQEELEFELDQGNLYDYICQQAFILYQRDKEAIKSVSVDKGKEGRVTVSPIGTYEALLREEAVNIDHYAEPQDESFYKYVVKVLEPVNDNVSITLVKNRVSKDYELLVQAQIEGDSKILDDIDLIMEEVDVEAFKSDRVVAPRTDVNGKISWIYRVTAIEDQEESFNTDWSIERNVFLEGVKSLVEEGLFEDLTVEYGVELMEFLDKYSEKKGLSILNKDPHLISSKSSGFTGYLSVLCSEKFLEENVSFIPSLEEVVKKHKRGLVFLGKLSGSF